MLNGRVKFKKCLFKIKICGKIFILSLCTFSVKVEVIIVAEKLLKE